MQQQESQKLFALVKMGGNMDSAVFWYTLILYVDIL